MNNKYNVDEMIECYKERENINDVSERFNVIPSYIYKLFRKANFKTSGRRAQSHANLPLERITMVAEESFKAKEWQWVLSRVA